MLRSGILSPNTEVTYVMAFPDLDKTGPLVLEYPAGGMVGIVMDYWQRPQSDYGLTGPTNGKTGGKILIVGPGQTVPKDAAGYTLVTGETERGGPSEVERSQSRHPRGPESATNHRDRNLGCGDPGR